MSFVGTYYVINHFNICKVKCIPFLMPKMDKYQLTQFCPEDKATGHRLENYLIDVGLYLKLSEAFGHPLERSFKVEKPSVGTEKPYDNNVFDSQHFMRTIRKLVQPRIL